MRIRARRDVILHPQRMAILRSLGVRSQTTRELAGSLPGLPQATLYRHLSVLLDAGVIRVSDERHVRGTVERTFALADRQAVVSGEELRDASRDDHFRFFAIFAGGLLSEYGRYLDRTGSADSAPVDLEADGVGFREHVLNLTDGELREMLTELRAVLEARAGNPLTEGRIPRLFATASMPLDRPVGAES